MMIDATVAPKVGFVSPFGTTACNVNHINAGPQPLLEAGARHELTLEAVGCRRLFGDRLSGGFGPPMRATASCKRLSSAPSPPTSDSPTGQSSTAAAGSVICGKPATPAMLIRLNVGRLKAMRVACA